jgi:hypothetical protein
MARPPTEWTTYAERIRIVADRLNCDRHKAKRIVHRAYISMGICEPYSTQNQFEFRKCPRHEFEAWLDLHYPAPTMPEPPLQRGGYTRSKTVTPENINEAWDRYSAIADTPDMDGFVAFARDNMGITDREAARSFYRNAMDKPGPGRRSKKSAKIPRK